MWPGWAAVVVPGIGVGVVTCGSCISLLVVCVAKVFSPCQLTPRVLQMIRPRLVQPPPPYIL